MQEKNYLRKSEKNVYCDNMILYMFTILDMNASWKNNIVERYVRNSM